jgi:D-alanyl-D-alanine carboxypeptidase/D-alanyl-D-alanine-endopeptidase (penicillin-binding protein 4)
MTMHSFKPLVALLAVATSWLHHGAAAQSLPEPVVQAFTRAGIPRQAIGVLVQDVSATVPTMQLNADSAFNPASVMKLVTTNAALELLGPAFTWRTQAFATGLQSGDVLQGDLVVRGGGDPKLVVENFWLFLRQVRARGIREIRGNLVLDRSYFQAAVTDPAAFDGDPHRPYNAAPDALLLNYRALSLRFLPDAAAGMVRVSTEPAVDGYPVATPQLGGGACNDWKRALRGRPGANGINFDGVYPASCGERTWSMHAWQVSADQYFGLVFRQIWRELGGVFTGDIRAGAVPADARLLVEWRSPALSEVVRDINKYSNNVMAHQLLLTIGTQVSGQPGDIQGGGDAVRAWLAAKGISAPELVIDNGSGLSRSAQLTPRMLGKLLVSAFHSPSMAEFMSSMPLAGLDGTMRNRLQQIAGTSHIKTGSLNSVRSIAGYVLAASGRRYAVVSIVNHANAPASQAAHDALLRWIVEKG